NEHQILLNKVENSPKPKWTYLSNRRLQNWGGLPHAKGMMKEPLPIWLEIYCKKLAVANVFDGHIPNHILINEYLPGQGIMPHEDGSLFYPTVATVNLGSHSVVNFYKKGETQELVPDYLTEDNAGDYMNNKQILFSLLVQPRSLLILKEDAYKNYMHGIQEISKDLIDDSIANLGQTGISLNDTLERKTRISLTIRYVPKVFKTTLSLFKK
ncbi:hypothetical protein B4U80_00034, partial [Leptotrombidium deliense]